jgi:hypothetical protein
MAVLINSINDGSIKLPGEYGRGNSSYNLRSPAPIVAAAPAVLFPGLFAGRQGTDFTTVTSIDQLTTPTVENIVGVVARQKAAYGGLAVGYQSIPANALPAGKLIDLLTRQEGYVYVWAGTALTDPTKVYIATTTTGTGSTLVLAGSLVSAATSGALDISAISTFSALSAGAFSYNPGDLVPVCIADLNR